MPVDEVLKCLRACLDDDHGIPLAGMVLFISKLLYHTSLNRDFAGHDAVLKLYNEVEMVEGRAYIQGE